MLRFLLFLFLTSSAYGASLSCSSPEAQTISYWENLTSSQIDAYINSAQLDGIDLDVFKNQIVSLSYLELFKTSQINSGSRLMGYVYANASHHLGRLVRYHYWEDFQNEPLAIRDRSLITGDLLGSTVRTFPLTLSRRLMAHSLALYKTLAWSLTAESKCGQKFVQNLLDHGGTAAFKNLPSSKHVEVFSLLREAFQANNLTTFMRKFVAFEQTYLQYTMYSMPDIRVPTSLGMLDKMRFIPFNGEKQMSFFEWCANSKCGSTSLDLKKRISFDQAVITNELPVMNPMRLKRTEILNVARFIFKGYCRDGKITRELCP